MPEQKLEGTLSFPVILLITINSIMGTGVFFLPALGAGISGPMSLVAWFFLSFVSIYIAMCFGELASMFPTAGGIYEYCKQAYGSFTSFLIGWGTLIVGNITIAMLVVGAIRYLNPGLNEAAKIAISLFFIFLFNFMAYRGLQTSAVMLVTFAIITLSSILGLTIPGLFNFNPSNFDPFFTHSWPLVFATIFFIAETFFGWETATFLAEETKNPRKVIPKALVWGTIIISVICLLFVLAMLSTINWEILGSSVAPLTDMGNIIYGGIGGSVFTIMVYLSIIGSVAGWIVSAPRLILALAEDKLFLTQCAKIHPKNKTPYIAILFQTILTSFLVIVGSGSYETLLHLLLPLVLVIYSFTIFTVVILRFKKPDLERPYKVSFGIIGPILVIFFLLGLVGYWALHDPTAIKTIKLATSFIVIGTPIYFLLNYYYNPSAIQKTLDKLAHVKYATEDFNLPKKVRKEVLSLLGDIKGKRILEHGSGVGTLTLELSESAGPDGMVYATNISKGEIDVLQTRLNKNEIINVSAIHDVHHSSRIHPEVPKVDIIVSIESLGYTQDINKIATDMYNKLPIGGKICIVEYIDLYKILPNAGWLSDLDAIYDIFKTNGFLVRVVKKKGLLWNYLYVYGIKAGKSNMPYI